MRPNRTLLSIVFACLLALPQTFSQSTSTQGKEFWLSFMHNGFKDHTSGGWVTTQVLVSAKRDCTGTVSNPLTGWSRGFSVSANDITVVEIPEEQGYHDGSQYERIYEKGIRVLASDTVSVYCTNIAHVSFDASFVLPVESLGNEYIVQCCEQSRPGYNPYVWNNETTAFVVVAVEDNTVVDLTPTVRTLGGHAANQTFSVTMHAGETYPMRSNRLTGDPIDLSGTRIHARGCKRIAVFNGNTVTCVPSDAGNGYDHVFEQAMPLHSWGKNFVVTSSKNRVRDFVKVTSSADDNVVTMNGVPMDTLSTGGSLYFPMLESEGSCYLQTTHPSAVYLYNSSHDATQGDPSMVWIAPVEQRIKDVTFSTFDHPDINIETHSVNIIVHTKDSASVHFDGALLPPSSFQRVNGNDDYSYTRMDISHGVHRITCSNGFNAHVYGFGQAKGYAYLAGSNTTKLSSTITVDDILVGANDTIGNCTSEPVAFFADVNHENYELLWDFGDGTTSTDNPVVHDYGDPDLYEARLTVTTEDDPCSGSTSSTTVFYVNTHHDPDMFYADEICAGQLYSNYGFTDVPITSDTTLTREQPNPLNPYCSSLVTVDIHCLPATDTTIMDFVCFESPGVYTENGFHLPYDRPGTYLDSIVSTDPYGCESVVHLHLEIGEANDTPVQYESDCDAFEWLGHTYTSSGVYTDTLFDAAGCYTIRHLDLELHYSPHPSEIYPVDTANHAPHWVVTATEFQINSYEFSLYDLISPEPWDSVKWEFVDPDVQWVLERDTVPFLGKRCKMYVLDHIDDTIWLRATPYDECDTEGTTSQLYWFVCSFYGIDEHDAPSGLHPFDVDLHPNPTNGIVTVTGENLRQAVVVNMLGQQVLILQDKGNELNIDITSQPQGIYFVNVTDKHGRKCTRKILKK